MRTFHHLKTQKGKAFTALFCLLFALTACNREEPLSARIATSSLAKTTDPVLQHYAKLGLVQRAPASFTSALSACSPTLGLYWFTPSYGPRAGQRIEIHRYHNWSEVLGPCGDEFNLEYHETELQGYTWVDCPVAGTDCYTMVGPGTCIIVHCDEDQ